MGAYVSQSEFWHWKHLECWQSWSHLFRSQNSNFGFSALLMMMKKPPVCSLDFWHHWLPVPLLWEKTAQSALLRRAGAEGYVLCPTARAVPHSPEAKVMAGITWSMARLTFSVASCHCGLLCALHFIDTTVICTSFKRNREPYIYTIKNEFLWNPAVRPLCSWLFLMTALCIHLSSWNSFTTSVAVFFFQRRNILYFKCSQCLITRSWFI